MPAHVEDIDFWQIADLLSYWRDHPPVAELIAGYLGVKPAPKVEQTSANSNDPSGFGAMVAMFPSGFVPAAR